MTNENGSRLNYIFESIKKYQQLDLSRYDSAIVFISMPSEYPVDETETDSFKSNVQQLLGYKNILWGNIKTTDDSKEIEVMLMLNKLDSTQFYIVFMKVHIPEHTRSLSGSL